MELLHGADDEQLPMPVFTLPPTPRYTIALPCSVTVRTRAPHGLVSAAPALPETFWTFLARAWFFLAGVTVGVLFAAALIAIAAQASPPRATAGANGARAAAPQAAQAPMSTSVSARKLVVVRPPIAADRASGEARTGRAVRRRTAAAPHKPAPARRNGGGSILDAAL
jgi:hypothetical protein